MRVAESMYTPPMSRIMSPSGKLMPAATQNRSPTSTSSRVQLTGDAAVSYDTP